MAQKPTSPDGRCPSPTLSQPPAAGGDKGPPPSLLRRVYARFVKLRGCPREIARGFALGLFVGMSPTLGAQMLIAVPLASLCKSNKLAAAAGVWVTNPLSAPFIYGFTYLVGARVIGISGPMKANGFDGATLLEIVTRVPELFWALTVGGVLVGIPLAVAGYFLSLAAITRYRAKIQPKIAASRQKLAQRQRTKRKKTKGRKN